jgi:SpoVK/Ycf46/Vps4 family AAA+-type ATPase
VAATNHSELLDPAIWRRFDMVMEFPLPDAAAIAAFVRSLLDGRVSELAKWADILSLAFRGRSFSDIERELISARRTAAISKSPLEQHLALLVTGAHLTKGERIDLATTLVDSGIASQRAAHDLTGVSRDTIRTRTASDKPIRRRRIKNG